MIPQGTQITCPQCKEVIAITAVDIVNGMISDASLITGVKRVIRNGDIATCDSCGSAWFSPHSGKLHTIEGWKP